MAERDTGRAGSATRKLKAAYRREVGIGSLLVVCALVVVFWEVMGARSRSRWEAYEVGTATFADFVPAGVPGAIRPIPLRADPLEPNILMYEWRAGTALPAPSGPDRDPAERRLVSPVPIIVRLVHGYNMRDCMRIKGYGVEMIGDTRVSVEDGGLPYQLWRLTSPIGDRSIWVTSMLRSSDLSATGVDVTSLAFPRVGTPDDPGWLPQGFTWAGLRHPIRNLKQFARGRWNSARSDWLTFLGLRRPARADEELFTLVTASRGLPASSAHAVGDVSRCVLAAHHFLYGQLRGWRVGRAE